MPGGVIGSSSPVVPADPWPASAARRGACVRAEQHRDIWNNQAAAERAGVRRCAEPSEGRHSAGRAFGREGPEGRRRRPHRRQSARGQAGQVATPGRKRRLAHARRPEPSCAATVNPNAHLPKSLSLAPGLRRSSPRIIWSRRRAADADQRSARTTGEEEPMTPPGTYD